MSKKIDYSKPFYINSFDAYEIIFHMLRGSAIKADKYDGSLPVSLDSLKIKELCKKDKSICTDKSLFRDVKSKTFSDAVINVNFSVDLDYTKVNFIKEDAKRANSLNLDNMLERTATNNDGELISYYKETYKEFLNNYIKNRKALENKSENNQQVIKYPDDCKEFMSFSLCEDNQYQVTKLSVKMRGTRAIISTTIKRSKDADNESINLGYYVYFKESGKKRANLIEVYEEEIIGIIKSKSKTKNLKSIYWILLV